MATQPNPVIVTPAVNLTWRHIGEFVLGVVLLLALYFWFSSHEENVKAAATQSANEKIISANDAQQKANDAQVKALQAQVVAMQADYLRLQADQARQLAAVQATFARATTPAQSASLTDILLALKAGTTTVGGTAEAPTLIVPKADLVAYQQTCEECKVKLPILTSQLKNVSDQLTNTNTQLDAANKDKVILTTNLTLRTQERDQWETAAKGGTWIHRTLKAIGIAACAGAGGAGGYAASSKNAAGAAIGAAGAAVACTLLIK